MALRILWVAVLVAIKLDVLNALECYSCGGQNCPTDLSTATKVVCQGNEQCVSENVFFFDGNDQIIANRTNTNRYCGTVCRDGCLPKSSQGTEQTCQSCCATNLCNTASPAPTSPPTTTPSSAVVFGNQWLMWLTSGMLLLSALLLK